MFAEKFLDVNSELFHLMEENNLIEEEEKERFLQFSSSSLSLKNQQVSCFSALSKKTQAIAQNILNQIRTCKVFFILALC